GCEVPVYPGVWREGLHGDEETDSDSEEEVTSEKVDSAAEEDEESSDPGALMEKVEEADVEETAEDNEAYFKEKKVFMTITPFPVAASSKPLASKGGANLDEAVTEDEEAEKEGEVTEVVSEEAVMRNKKEISANFLPQSQAVLGEDISVFASYPDVVNVVGDWKLMNCGDKKKKVLEPSLQLQGGGGLEVKAPERHSWANIVKGGEPGPKPRQTPNLEFIAPKNPEVIEIEALDFEEEDLDNGGGCDLPPPNQLHELKGDELNLTSQASGVAPGTVISEENGKTEVYGSEMFEIDKASEIAVAVSEVSGPDSSKEKGSVPKSEDVSDLGNTVLKSCSSSVVQEDEGESIIGSKGNEGSDANPESEEETVLKDKNINNEVVDLCDGKEEFLEVVEIASATLEDDSEGAPLQVSTKLRGVPNQELSLRLKTMGNRILVLLPFMYKGFYNLPLF
ncbi:hypothetical protein U1Q18_047379, partial [Sarracenia purpurea var. burkii]